MLKHMDVETSHRNSLSHAKRLGKRTMRKFKEILTGINHVELFAVI